MLKICFLFAVLSLGHGLYLNKVVNFRITADPYQVLLNRTENECICEMMSSSQMMSTLNYFLSNQTCQLFYSNLTIFDLEWNMNCTLIYTYQSILASSLGKFVDGSYWYLSFHGNLFCFFNRTHYDDDNNNNHDHRIARLVCSISHFCSRVTRSV